MANLCWRNARCASVRRAVAPQYWLQSAIDLSTVFGHTFTFMTDVTALMFVTYAVVLYL